MKKFIAIIITILALIACLFGESESGSRVAMDHNDSEEEVITKATTVTPTGVQYGWQTLELTALIPFGMSTFTSVDFGNGGEDPQLFNPTDFDAKQWVSVLKESGFKLLILTAKNQEGFCLWPTSTTDYSIRRSPWKGGNGDVVRAVAEACKEAGIEFGVYLSIWDSHEKTFGTSAYNEFYKAQLKELLTNYGPVAEVWMDPACFHELEPRCDTSKPDMDGYIFLIKELQPNAVISWGTNDGVRWAGNEIGAPRVTEWSVIPEVTDFTLPGDLGSRDKLMYFAMAGSTLVWWPSESDVPIRPRFFYHSEENNQIKSLQTLIQIYHDTTGNNSQLLLGIPPNPRGLISNYDVMRLREFKEYLDNTFTIDYAKSATLICNQQSVDSEHAIENTIDGNYDTYWTVPDGLTSTSIIYSFEEQLEIDTVVLQEYIKDGQRIEEFSIDVMNSGQWVQVAHGLTVGYKKINDFDPVETSKVRVNIIKSRIRPTLSSVGIHNSFKAPHFEISGTVTSGASALMAVTINLSGAAAKSTTTDSNGNYSFSGLANGAYTITPSKTGYTFTHATIDVNVSGADVTGQNFAARLGAATLVSPSGTISTSTPAYTWNADALSTWYLLYVNDSFGHKINTWYSAVQAGCSGGTCTCTVAPGIPLASGSGKWWLLTWNSYGYGPWSDGMSFTVPAPVPPDKVTLTSPLESITPNNWPAFTWNVASDGTWYLLWVNDSIGNRINNWYSAATNCSGGSCSVAPGTALGAGPVKWWVQSWSPNGYGPWSEAGTFTAPVPVPPGKATLVSPSGSIGTTTPTFSWNADSQSSWYWLWVSDSTENKISHWYSAAQAGCGSGTGTCLVSLGIALAPGSGKWWVDTWNPNGMGPWSDGMGFIVP
jgi:alpha-L-fucosidase